MLVLGWVQGAANALHFVISVLEKLAFPVMKLAILIMTDLNILYFGYP